MYSNLLHTQVQECTKYIGVVKCNNSHLLVHKNTCKNTWPKKRLHVIHELIWLVEFFPIPTNTSGSSKIPKLSCVNNY